MGINERLDNGTIIENICQSERTHLDQSVSGFWTAESN